jgi:hypothetical protein
MDDEGGVDGVKGGRGNQSSLEGFPSPPALPEMVESGLGDVTGTSALSVGHSGAWRPRIESVLRTQSVVSALVESGEEG